VLKAIFQLAASRTERRALRPDIGSHLPSRDAGYAEGGKIVGFESGASACGLNGPASAAEGEESNFQCAVNRRAGGW
jgi:hypothetical protein